MRNGRVLYEGIWDNKPPLLYIVYAIFNGDQFYARIASLIFGVLATIAFYYLAKRILGDSKENQKAVMWSTGIFAFIFASPIIEGNIANAENFMLFPIILSALLIFKEKLNPKKYLIIGVILGIAFLFKIVAIFDFAAFSTFILITNINVSRGKINILKIIEDSIKLLWPFVIGFTLPIIVTALFFLGPAFKYFIQATFTQNVGYVGYGNKLIFPQGFLILKLIVLAAFNLYLFLRKTKFSKNLLFVLIWTSFSLFNAFFAQRPYTHYLLILLPSISLLIGYVLIEKKNKVQLLLLLLLSIVLIFMKFKTYGKTAFYYQNFFAFITGNKSVDEYRGFFDRKTPKDYEIAQYIKMKTSPEDHIFIWGNNAQVYKLSDKLPPGRYTVAYHITNYKDGFSNTQEALEKTRPKLIIIMPNQPNPPFSLAGYGSAMRIEDVTIYGRTL